jgi:hypothetical protein
MHKIISNNLVGIIFGEIYFFLSKALLEGCQNKVIISPKYANTNMHQFEIP